MLSWKSKFRNRDVRKKYKIIIEKYDFDFALNLNQKVSDLLDLIVKEGWRIIRGSTSASDL